MNSLEEHIKLQRQQLKDLKEEEKSKIEYIHSEYVTKYNDIMDTLNHNENILKGYYLINKEVLGSILVNIYNKLYGEGCVYVYESGFIIKEGYDKFSCRFNRILGFTEKIVKYYPDGSEDILVKLSETGYNNSEQPTDLSKPPVEFLMEEYDLDELANIYSSIIDYKVNNHKYELDEEDVISISGQYIKNRDIVVRQKD